MKIEFTRKFKKQAEACTNKLLIAKIRNVINEVMQANSISEIKNMKKLKGAKYHYRIRVGDYRIGLYYKKDLVIFAAFDHRSDIYKYFP